MSRVTYQQFAKNDLLDAWMHIAADNVSVADSYIERLRETCALIADNPKMGVDRSDIDDGVRSFPVDNYIIYYEISQVGINVLRFWHTSRDPADLILN